MARSRAYPIIGLEEAVQAAETIQAQLGGGLHDRDSLAGAIGYSRGVGLAARKIAALVQFGLLAREGAEYQLSELVDQILTPRSDEEEEEGVRRAFGNPPLFDELTSRFRAQGRLPRQLANILARDHGIQRKVADDAASAYVSSGQFAGVLDGHGAFVANGATDTGDDPVDENDEPAEDDDSSRSERSTKSSFGGHGRPTAEQRHAVVLSSGVAQIQLPAHLTDTDVKKLKVLFSTVTQLAELDAVTDDNAQEGR
jgi:hypothetical protein